jgi:hypothetical protein
LAKGIRLLHRPKKKEKEVTKNDKKSLKSEKGEKIESRTNFFLLLTAEQGMMIHSTKSHET